MTEILAARSAQQEPPVGPPVPSSPTPNDAAANDAAANDAVHDMAFDGSPDQPDSEAVDDEAPGRSPIYPRLLHLQHLRPNAWQRAVLGEGMAVVGALLAMADLASAWSIVVLPLAVAAVVKGHDVLAGVLITPATPVDDA